jgi:inner membrane transporter RhtA
MASAQTRALHTGVLARAPSTGLVLAGIASVQFGSALAATLFATVGAGGAVFLRLAWATVVLWAVWRPRVRTHSARQLRLAVTFGVVLGVMNIAFYQAIARIPLGIAVAIEFLGPLTVAVVGSRRRLDLAWVGLAALGVLALTRGSAHGLDAAGVLLALLAGAAWAAYILCNARMGREFADGSGLALAMAVACALSVPVGIADGGGQILTAHALLVGAAVGLLSSVIPYTVEMEALRRIAPGRFGVLMSLEPALAALAGFLVVGQALTTRELVGIGLVVMASIGVSRRGVDEPPPRELTVGRAEI